MAMNWRHRERHLVHRIGWLRAAVLGANDGVISVSALILGVAGAGPARNTILLSGLAAWIAGAMSMAAGEYVSVSSQADTERADLQREKDELRTSPGAETAELAGIYAKRGVSPDLAKQVAKELMAKDALEAHARDELGISEATAARPVQAALTSAATFSAGALPLLVATALVPATVIAPATAALALIALAVLGAVGARAGGAPVLKSVLRVLIWGALALGVTFAAGRLFGATV
jgi:VIT1/CCC1 family predicted Fe2+/Mn2+ transporter